MSQETWDIIQGAALLVPFLILVFVAAKVLAAFRNRRFNHALSPLAPLINGTLHSDGIHGLMTGTYQGKEVGVSVTLGTRSLMFEGHSNQKRNILDIEMAGLPGRQDWRFVFGNEWVLDKNRWRIKADDKALEERLNHSGVANAINDMGNVPAIMYLASRKVLAYTEDIRPDIAPSPERFQQQLELLVYLAQVNNRVNPA